MEFFGEKNSVLGSCPKPTCSEMDNGYTRVKYDESMKLGFAQIVVLTTRPFIKKNILYFGTWSEKFPWIIKKDIEERKDLKC